MTLRLASALPLPVSGPLPFPVAVVPSDRSLDATLLRWRSAGVQAIVHPRGPTLESDEGVARLLLTALYVGAVPVLETGASLSHVGEDQGVLRVSGDEPSWRRALAAIRDAGARSRLLARLERFCASDLSGAPNARVLDGLLAGSPPTDLLTWAHRVRQCQWSQVGAVIDLQGELAARSADARQDLEQSVPPAVDDARLLELDEEVAIRGARLARLEEELVVKDARLAELEREMGSRAHAVALWLRDAVGLVRRLVLWRRPRR
jgi:hypothetical protein